MKRIKDLASYLLVLMLVVAFMPVQASAAEITTTQAVNYQNLQSGVEVMDDGIIYAVSGSSVRGFNDGGTNVFSASLPAKCGNLADYGQYLFAAGYMSGHMNDLYVLTPGTSSSCKTLDAGQRVQAVATDNDGYLYIVNSTGTRSNGKKATKISRAKISDVVSLASGETITWTKEYQPDYTPPSSDGNCYPQSIALDGNGNIYIADKGSSNGNDASVNGIFRYEPKTGDVTTMTFTAGSTQRLFTWIYDVCADDYGTVAVVGRNNYEIAVFRKGSTSSDAIIKAAGFPEGVGTDASGNIYYNAYNNSDTAKNGIYRINMGNVAVTGLSLSYSSKSVAAGDSFTLKATVSPSDATNKDIIYTSSDSSVASVGSTGKVTAKAAGTATITAKTVQGRKTAKCTVTVSKKEQTVTLSSTKFTKTFGNAAFSLGAKTNGDGTLKYSSDNTKVATVSTSGKVTVKGAGTAKITIYAAASDKYKKSGSKTVSITVNKAANTMTAKGKTATVKYSKLKKKDQTIKKASAFAVSSAKGTVTYKKTKGNKKITVAGTGKITVKKGLKKGTYKVTVKVTAKGTANYKAATKTATVTVKVK